MYPSRRLAALLAAASLLLVGALTASRSWGQSAPPQRRVDPALPMKLAPEQPRTRSGFRMEGPPEVELLFGDSDSFRRQVDRFHTLHEHMSELRRTFSRNMAAATGTLPHDSRHCPDEVAVPYYRAWLAGRSYEKVGNELEALYQAIQRLDALGESTGLPPGARWKVEQAHAAYQSALVDYAEMRAVMEQHLEPELRFRRCQPGALLHQGALQAPGGLSTSAPLANAAVTFFIDNRECDGSFHLFVDGALLGSVMPHQKVAFQTTSGRHTMCLIVPSSALACGDPGTVRVAQVYDGWSMTTHCR